MAARLKRKAAPRDRPRAGGRDPRVATAFVRLATAPGYAADTLDWRLDERQRLVRDRAHRVACYVLTLLFGALSLAVLYAAGNGEAWPSVRIPALVLPWLAFLPGSLPTAVVAWTEPGPPEDI